MTTTIYWILFFINIILALINVLLWAYHKGKQKAYEDIGLTIYKAINGLEEN